MKFLKKKGVRIGMIVAAVLLLALIVYFCVRPVSVGYSYVGTSRDVTYHFDTFDKVTVDGVQFWYFEKDGMISTSEGPTNLITKEVWETEKELTVKLWNKNAGPKINAFSFDTGADCICPGAIATVVTMALVEAGLVALIVLSFKSKGKKKRK